MVTGEDRGIESVSIQCVYMCVKLSKVLSCWCDPGVLCSAASKVCVLKALFSFSVKMTSKLQYTLTTQHSTTPASPLLSVKMFFHQYFSMC